MVACEMIDVIIPIRCIERVYPGGFVGYCGDNFPAFGKRLWHDGVILRDGAMSAPGVQYCVDHWQSLGLTPMDNGRWQDLCVVESLAGGPTLRCDWIRMHDRLPGAFHVGHETAPAVSRLVMNRHLPSCSSGADIARLFQAKLGDCLPNES